MNNYQNKITFYNFNPSQLKAFSFYLNGFLENQKKFGYRFTVKVSPPSIFNSTICKEERIQSVAFFKASIDGNEYYFCIDRSDHSTNYMNEGYHPWILKKVQYYFKANYSRAFLKEAAELKPYESIILPALPSFPIRLDPCLPFSINYRSIKLDSKLLAHARFLYSNYRNIKKLEAYRKFRKKERRLDVFFVMFYYPQPHHKEMNEFRYEIIRALNQRTSINAIAGFAHRSKLPKKYALAEIPEFTPKAYFENLGKSRIAIYVRGPHNGISSKFGHYLAFGKPIVGQPIHVNHTIIYQNKYFKEQFAYDDPKEMVHQVERLLEEPQRQVALGKSNAKTFDAVFSPRVAVARIIDTLFKSTSRITRDIDE